MNEIIQTSKKQTLSICNNLNNSRYILKYTVQNKYETGAMEGVSIYIYDFKIENHNFINTLLY